MSLKTALAGCLALAAVSAHAADDQMQAVHELANTLMQMQTVLAVTNLTDPAKFVPDNDPETLQIVYIDDPKLGANHVSPDGEVVWFFGDVNVNVQQPYIFSAFEKKAKLKMGIK